VTVLLSTRIYAAPPFAWERKAGKPNDVAWHRVFLDALTISPLLVPWHSQA
jgi:hypothetical protein